MCNRLLEEMAWQHLLLLPPYKRLVDKRSVDRMGTEELLLKKAIWPAEKDVTEL